MCKNRKVAHKLGAIFYSGFGNEGSLDSMTHERCVNRARVTHILCASGWKVAHNRCVTGIFRVDFIKKVAHKRCAKKQKWHTFYVSGGRKWHTKDVSFNDFISISGVLGGFFPSNRVHFGSEVGQSAYLAKSKRRIPNTFNA